MFVGCVFFFLKEVINLPFIYWNYIAISVGLKTIIIIHNPHDRKTKVMFSYGLVLRCSCSAWLSQRCLWVNRGLLALSSYIKLANKMSWLIFDTKKETMFEHVLEGYDRAWHTPGYPGYDIFPQWTLQNIKVWNHPTPVGLPTYIKAKSSFLMTTVNSQFRGGVPPLCWFNPPRFRLWPHCM